MNQTRLDRIQADLQRAPTILYLEGKTDEEVLWALTGVPRPSSSIHKRVYVAGLKTGSHGGKEVQELVRAAAEAGLSGKPGSGGVFGVIDGDGRELSELNASFQAPFPGPLFSWPTYCIENLLAITWPEAWGVEPDWAAVLGAYVPYAALNRVHTQLQHALQTLRLAKFQSPIAGSPLRTVGEVKEGLARDKQQIADRDVEDMFDQESRKLHLALEASFEEAHALINGKWMVSHHAAHLHPGRDTADLRKEWAAAVLAKGGHPAVRDLWSRIAGEAP